MPKLQSTSPGCLEDCRHCTILQAQLELLRVTVGSSTAYAMRVL